MFYEDFQNSFNLFLYRNNTKPNDKEEIYLKFNIKDESVEGICNIFKMAYYDKN